MESPPSAPTWEQILQLLLGAEAPADRPEICSLYRAIFCLRQAAPSQAAGVSLLIRALQLRRDAGGPRFQSVLFRHECCYLLGQLGADCADAAARREAFDCLYEVLLDEAEDEVTRHEAAEGIAAVHEGEEGDLGGLEASPMFQALERLSHQADGRGPLAETCYLAVEGMRRKGAKKVCACQYASHDPAIGDLDAKAEDIPRYEEQLLQGDVSLFQRYVAMFTLRNLGADKSLATALAVDRTSCVLRHELAFVLGQMESEAAVQALVKNLSEPTEHAMVRHEAAIALGSIGGETAKACLQQFSVDEEPMVSESCLVALDTVAYWEAWERLEQRMRDES